MKKLVCFNVACVILLTWLNLPIYAVSIIDEPIVLPAEGDYANNRVIVVLENSNSLEFKTYSIEDFSFINCKSVKDLSKPLTDKLKTRYDNVSNHILKNEPLTEYTGIEFHEFNQMLCIELNDPGRDNVISAINKLSRLDGIKSVYPDLKLEISQTPNDEYYNEQNDYLELIEVDDAWNKTTGSSTVKVGVIDTGIDADHPDLSDVVNEDLSVDFTTNVPTIGISVDEHGHGTHVAGIISAEGNNRLGVSGVCWNIELISLRVLQGGTDSWASKGISAIYYASANDFDILNISLSVRNTTPASNNILNEMGEAISNFDGLVVAAAGNVQSESEEPDNDFYNIYPANFSYDNLITVGASNINDEIADFSHYGEFTVDVFAPGVNIVSTFPRLCSSFSNHNNDQHIADGYHMLSGTSMATPIVTGVAALMLSKNPNLIPDEIKNIIIKCGVEQPGEFDGMCVSEGRINAKMAVNHATIYQHVRTSSELDTYCDYADCNTCGYSYSREHKKYVYEYYVENSELPRYQARCRYNCGFVVDLCDSPEYGLADRNTHLVTCPSGCYDFREEHVMIYTATSSYLNHQRRCSSCGYSDTEAHKWWDAGYEIRCLKCNKLQYREPEILSLPPVNETSSDETE